MMKMMKVILHFKLNILKKLQILTLIASMWF